MSLTDPTSGAGYSFGERLPSSHMTAIATQQPNALDAVNGGTYSSLAGAVNIDGAVTWTWGSQLTVQYVASVDYENTSVSTWKNGSSIALNDGATATFNGTANWPLVASQTITRACPMTPLLTSGSFAVNVAGTLQDSSTGSSFLLDITDCCPDDATLTAVRVRLAPAVHGSLPAVMPQLKAFHYDDSASSTTLGTQSDTSANVSAYNAIHTVSLTGLSQAIDRESFQRIIVQVIGESGANSQNDLICINCRAEFTITKLAPGA